ncbi:MAG: hypothetical protein IPI67_27010 [Myxococcales bacterium]|nr:hypothetical protein [Myxococcales bacterium]
MLPFTLSRFSVASLSVGAVCLVALAALGHQRAFVTHARLERLPVPVVPVLRAAPVARAGVGEALTPADEFSPPPCPTGPTIDAFFRSWCPEWPDVGRPPLVEKGAWRGGSAPKPSAL